MISEIVSKTYLQKKIDIDKFIDESVNGTVFACTWFSEIKHVQQYIITYSKQEIVCIMPLFCNETSPNLNQSTMYIPYGGPIIKRVPKEERNKIRFLRELNTSIILLLKQRFNNISFSIDPFITDVMPFIRNGFMPEIRYTYKLDIGNPDELFFNYGHDRRKEIRKATKNKVLFKIDDKIEFTEISKYVEWEKKYGFDSSVSEVSSILSQAIKHDNGMCFVAMEGDIVIGSVGMLWRRNTAYIMYSYFDRNFDLGAIAFLYDNIFKYLNKEKGIKYIDFEGSVYESVENWNISFGAYQERFYNLHFCKDGNDEIARSMYAYFEK